MPDIAAGHRLTTLDFLPRADDEQVDAYTATNTTFGVGTTGGTYNDCGVEFVAPYTERVTILFGAEGWNETASASVVVAPVVRTGGTVGSGSTIVAADAKNAYRNVGNVNNTGFRWGVPVPVDGLVAGDTYNVRLEHRVSGGIGHFSNRVVIVRPDN
jgi:hypothetical protein